MITRRNHNSANLILLLLFFVVTNAAYRSCGKPASRSSRVSTPVRNPIQDELRPNPSAQYREGIAAAILIDTSGSMDRKVEDADGRSRRKIEIAQSSALSLVKQFDGYAREHSGQPIVVGIYEFSERSGSRSPCRRV